METLSSLRDDRRGAILVMSVFMATFLVGCLWYVIGIGDAALYRQKMQDGADAVAYASAVYHARGMNIIAVMNLIMVVVLAILIALKLIQAVLIGVTAISTVLCAFPLTAAAACPVAAKSAWATGKVTSAISKVEPWVDKILRAFSSGQVWVARLTPWAGTIRSVVASQSYKPAVQFGGALSISMIPKGSRLGLPVQEESYEKFCERAGKLVGDVALGWLPGGLGKWGGPIFGKIASSFPGHFCGGSSLTGAYEGAKNDADQACKDAKADYDAAKEDDDPAFDTKKCKEDIGKELEAGGAGGIGGMGDGNGKTPKAVFGAAQNGDEYFQVYSLVKGDGDMVKDRTERGVRIPAWGKASKGKGVFASVMAQTEKLGFTQSEFYYDQVDKSKLAWGDYSDDAMWNMRWRARLRRVRIPGPNLGANLTAGGIPSWVPGIPDSLKEVGLGQMGKDISVMFGDNWFSGWLSGELGKDVKKAGNDVDSAVQLIIGSLTETPIIH